MKLRAFFCCLALFAVLLPLVALGANKNYPIAGMLDLVAPEAQIEITGVGAYHQGYRDFECVGFKNTSKKTATRVVFDFLYFADNKDYVGHDSFDRTGTYETGAGEDPYEYYAGNDLNRHKNCLAYTFPRPGISAIIVNVDRVEYSDGTFWDAPPQWRAPAPTTSPNAKPTP